jgi:hypothetical protein
MLTWCRLVDIFYPVTKKILASFGSFCVLFYPVTKNCNVIRFILFILRHFLPRYKKILSSFGSFCSFCFIFYPITKKIVASFGSFCVIFYPVTKKLFRLSVQRVHTFRHSRVSMTAKQDSEEQQNVQPFVVTDQGPILQRSNSAEN